MEGPAIEFSNGSRQFWLNGIRIFEYPVMDLKTKEKKILFISNKKRNKQ